MARRSDGLALRRAMPDRLLPGLVAAMAFLAALALAGAVGAALLAQRWNNGAAAVLTVQVPQNNAGAAGGAAASDRIAAVTALLSAEPAVSGLHRLDPAELSRLLSPWLGGVPGEPAEVLSLPAVLQLRLRPGRVLPPDLPARLDRAAPGTLVERNAEWSERLVALTGSLKACAALALMVVAGVAVAVVAAATRAGLSARRQAIEIVHGLGATDGYIAGRFASRATALALLGGALGTSFSVPLLLLLCRLAAPFAAPNTDPAPLAAAVSPVAALLAGWTRLPLPLWIGLPLLPVCAAAIGWGTAQCTVRAWLRQLP